jgi:Ca-activated chloride channel family protein
MMKTRILAILGLALLLGAIATRPVKADGIIIPEPPICDPCPIPSPMSQLVIRYHHVTVTIEDQVATTHVDQVFYNPNDWDVEGIYVFPIPEEAAVSDFILWMDGEPVQGEILDAEQARRTYEDIVATLRDPALLEYADQVAMQARVFPIPPMGERRIELEYSQALLAENGLVEYLYPLGTEKFSSEPLENVSITVDIASSQPIRAVYSPSHSISISREDEFHIRAGYEERDVLPDQDFSLIYSIGESEAFHLLSLRDPSDRENPDGFFLLLLAPGLQESVRAVPKEVMIVLDKSGSMEGEKFDQAQEAVRFILNKLNPEDRYNLVAFSTGVELFSNEMQLADSVDRAIGWVNQLTAEGSTDINRALLESTAILGGDRPSYLIFLTDGLPTVGEVESEKIIANLSEFAPNNLRLFTFGVGYDVDTYLLDSLAQAHQGRSTYVVPGEPLDEIVSTFYSNISIPVLTDLDLDFGDLLVYDLYPHPLPDLFKGSQIAIVGRYRDGGVTEVTLSGLADDLSQEFVFTDQKFDEQSPKIKGSSSSLPSLWATRKIGYLLQQVRLNGPQSEIIDEIVKISIRYGIVTPYTSYLVTEPLPLGEVEQERIAGEEFDRFSEKATLPSFGQQAVEEAEGQNSMANADAVAPAPAEAQNKVRTIGSRTFIHSDGKWIDTRFDPEQMKTKEVVFLSDQYFLIAKERPELADAFALGTRVIVLSGDEVYEVVEGPVANNNGDTNPTWPILNPDETIPTPDEDLIQDVEGSAEKSSPPCWSGLFISLIAITTIIFVRKTY